MTCKVRLTRTDVTFVIAVGTVAAIMLTAPHGVRMTFVIHTVVIMTTHTVMMTTAAVIRCRRIRICWMRQLIN
jgi:hypothetical protein